MVLVGEDGRSLPAADVVVVLTGFRPNLSILSELNLALTGYEQVRSVTAEIAGDHEAAHRVELVVPGASLHS